MCPRRFLQSGRRSLTLNVPDAAWVGMGAPGRHIGGSTVWAARMDAWSGKDVGVRHRGLDIARGLWPAAGPRRFFSERCSQSSLFRRLDRLRDYFETKFGGGRPQARAPRRRGQSPRAALSLMPNTQPSTQQARQTRGPRAARAGAWGARHDGGVGRWADHVA